MSIFNFDEKFVEELRDYQCRFIFQGHSEYAKALADYIDGLKEDREHANLTLTRANEHCAQTVKIQAAKILELVAQNALLEQKNALLEQQNGWLRKIT